MKQRIEHVILDQHLWLTNDRTIFWEEENALIVSDLHFGKTGHFRKSGIAVPATLYQEDLHRLLNNLVFFKAKKLIVVGDMFHSIANKELDLFEKWRNDLSYLSIHLIKGNHDILQKSWYEKVGIIIHEQSLLIAPFLFVHDLNAINAQPSESNLYALSGHIHPGVLVKGMSRQKLRFPCFYFGNQQAILPAFSRFTGIMPIQYRKLDTVYAIVDSAIVKVSG
ncbi:MAG: ligase-associated DNA damage response endonuclease PdeM [Chitinophagaceae bacterium]